MHISISRFRAQLEVLLTGVLGETSRQAPSISDFMAVAALSRLVVANIAAMAADDLAAVFGLIERVVAFGDEEGRNAATTGFLENMQSRASNGTFPFEQIAPFLGPASRTYCEEWDRFIGVKTSGID